jgi:hypothetical protein
MEVLSGPDSGRDQLLDLRASQLDSFMAEIRRFQTTGASSTELSDLAGNFIQTMTADGWFRDRVLLADDDVLRVMFKEMWTALIGLQRREDLAVTLDEQRVLYAFYLQYPHPSRAMREAIGTARNGLSSRADRSSDRVAIEAWRIDRINRLAAIDSTYPTEYAPGISQYRSGAFAASAAAFRAWLQLHPDGPWTMRARNYLLAAERAQLPD